MVSTAAFHPAAPCSLAEERVAMACDQQMASETAYYLANVGKVASITEFVGSRRLFSYAMKAHGLEDMNYAKGLMTQVLQGGVANPSTLAIKLGDPRYVAFATAFDFAGKGPGATRLPAATTGTVAKYFEQIPTSATAFSGTDDERRLPDRASSSESCNDAR